MGKPYTAILVPHTHWDREWYRTFQEFRRRLVRLTDGLLELMEGNESFPFFVFDGQTVVLEDYLEIRPENEGRLRRLVEAGRLHVGPWYVLADEFLVSGEALVRNLMLGRRIASRFGRVMRVGYVPDSFGHIGQLPQVLAGFGLGSAVFSRGVGPEREKTSSEFWWEGLDGTKVLGVHLLHAYGNAAALGLRFPMAVGGRARNGLDLESARERVKREVAALGPASSTRYLLLCNGYDHAEPQPELPELIAHLNSELEEAEVVAGSYEEFVGRVMEEKPELGKISGELRSGRFMGILPGVLSTRIYVKQENERTQALLERWAEPASALAWQEGGADEGSFLWKAWELCLKNHPHDSICGCSIDEVHREMMVRFAEARQIGEMLTGEGLQYLASRMETKPAETREGRPVERRPVVAFNPLGQAVEEVVTVKLARGAGVKERLPGWRVTTRAGETAPTQVVSEKLGEGRGLGGTRPHEVELRFLARELPACGYRVYELVGEEGKQESDLVVGPSSLENEALRVGVGDDGTVTVLHKETGAVFPGCLVFESTEDAGDEYNYSPAAQSETVTSEGAKAEIALVERGPVSATFRLGLELQLPEGLREDRLARSERRVACPITSYVTLHAGLPRVDFRTGVENRARDHRLRVLFPTAIEAEASHAETQFGVVSRPVDLPEWKGWAERPVPTHPQRSFVDVHDGKAGLCLINRGLPEYEARRGPQGTTLALTLLRCVGWLSRGDGAWRPYPVGPQVPTPEGQCLGSWEFHYSLFPHAGSWQEAQVWRQAHQFAAPPRALLTEGHAGALPGELSFFALSPAQLVLSALKKIESREALLVRLYNTTEAEIQGRLACYRRVRSARRVTLGEEALEGGAVAVSGKEIRFPVGRYEIVSLEIELA